MKHCKRDFKRESPQEYETWRELYLRLHDEREERLRKLTQNISSAHANKPKGIHTSFPCLLPVSMIASASSPTWHDDLHDWMSRSLHECAVVQAFLLM